MLEAGIPGVGSMRCLTRCCCAGGSPYAVVGILDTMRAIQPEISTIAMGTASSTATVLLVGRRIIFLTALR